MKTIIQSFAVIMFLAPLVAGENPVSTTADDSSSPPSLTEKGFKSTIAELELLAKSDDPGDYKLLEKIVKEIGKLQVQPISIGEIEFKKQRERKTRLLLRMLTTINDRIDPTFDREDVPQRNIGSPGGSYSAGIAPEAIDDPAVRREYMEALQKNREKAQNYRLQTELRTLRNRLIRRYIFPFTRQYFRLDNTEAQKELERLISEEIKYEELQKWLTEELEELDKKYYVQPTGGVVTKPPTQQDD